MWICRCPGSHQQCNLSILEKKKWRFTRVLLKSLLLHRCCQNLVTIVFLFFLPTPCYHNNPHTEYWKNLLCFKYTKTWLGQQRFLLAGWEQKINLKKSASKACKSLMPAKTKWNLFVSWFRFQAHDPTVHTVQDYRRYTQTAGMQTQGGRSWSHFRMWNRSRSGPSSSEGLWERDGSPNWRCGKEKRGIVGDKTYMPVLQAECKWNGIPKQNYFPKNHRHV